MSDLTMNHLTSEELVDALDGVLSSFRTPHLVSCADCQTHLDRLRTALDAARTDDILEPSPLFWDHFSAGVAERVAAESVDSRAAGSATGDFPAHRASARWLSSEPQPVWLAVAALLILAVIGVVRSRQMEFRPPVSNQFVQQPVASSPLESTSMADEESSEWTLMLDVMEGADWDQVGAELEVGPGAADRVVRELTGDERRELARLLEAELSRAKS
jgi:hypothetical protein